MSGTGMGGGTVLILILSFFLGLNQHVAQATNLIFFIPTSISAIMSTSKEHLINWKIGTTLAISGALGAIIGALISINMKADILKKFFGIFLAIIAIYEIYSLIVLYINDKKRDNNYKQKNK